MLQPGTTISGKYRILRLIGEGGMGSVYEAEHLVLGSRVALKFLHPEIAEQANLKQRFLQEARVSATVEDEHIARVTDVDTSAEGAYLVMELLKGEPLTNLLEREGRLDVERAVHFALQVGKGLRAAHERSIVHRDLKPDNVFIAFSANGPLLKLLDFGIAKLRQSQEYQMALTRPGAVMGTPEYMAPEQAFGAETVDHKSDIYSLGVMLFEMLSGQVPVEGQLPQEIAERILRGQVRHLGDLRPELPRELVAIVERAMSPRPELRFRDVEEFSQALLPFAPAVDRMSAASPLPSMARGFQTGLSTPFTPVAVTPLTNGRAAQLPHAPLVPHAPQVPNAPQVASAQQVAGPLPNAGPASAVQSGTPGYQSTLPPDDDGPPAASRLPDAPRIKTQSMPETSMPSIATAPTAVGGLKYQPPPHTSRRGGHGVAWTLLVLAVVGSAVAALIYYEPFADPETPPQPVPRPRPSTVLLEPPANFDDSELSPIAEQRPQPVRGGTPPNTPELPQLPPLTLPTQLPQLPPGLPTEFPRTIPIPGFPAPGLTDSSGPPAPSN